MDDTKRKRACENAAEKHDRIVKVGGGRLYEAVKRLFDIVSSLTLLVILSPLILILLAIKYLEDGKNPVYTSVRVGKRGKLIKFHKIRSMVPGAEALLNELIDSGQNEADGPVFKKKDDPRITRFGKFLRRSSLDELLQLWDIFVGSISVVGPRSPLPREVEKYDEYEMHRLDVKGGLLCLWQIQEDRHEMTFSKWVDLDIEYIENRSIALDMKIIFKGAVQFLTKPNGE